MSSLVKDEEHWRIEVLNSLGAPTITVVTSSMTGGSAFTPQANTTLIQFEAVGGGGGGGGLDGQTSAAGCSGPGGGGGVCIKTTDTIDASYDITIGGGGSGGAAGENDGSAGGTTTVVGSTGPGTNMNLSAPGGAAGTGRTSGTNQVGNSVEASDPSGGDINLRGAPAPPNSTFAGRPLQPVSGTAPGYGGGKSAHRDASGYSATNPGEGGGGAFSISATPNYAGGDGADGIVIVREWFG